MTVQYPGSESDLTTAAVLGRHLRESLEVTEKTERVLRLIIQHHESVGSEGKWPLVQCMILTRVADDLRAAASLALRGYFMQAMTIGASVYELTYTAAYIAQDDEKAAQWLEWTDPRKTPWGRRKMVTEVLAGVFGSRTSGDQARYMALCWAKHGNPRLQKVSGIAGTPAAHVLNADPSLGNKAHLAGELALYLMLWPINVYVLALLEAGYLPESARTAVEAQADAWSSFSARVWPPTDEAVT